MEKDYSLLGSVVLVTGGAGFIGSSLVDELISANVKVVVVDDLRQAGSRNIAHCLNQIHLEVADIGNLQELANVFERHRPEAVFHLAAIHFIPYCDAHPAETVCVNRLGTQHVAECCAKFGVKNIFYASTAAVYAPDSEPHRESSTLGPCDIYGVTKLAGEKIVRRMQRAPGSVVRIGRYFNAIGQRETNPHVIPEIYRQLSATASGVASLELGGTASHRDYIHARDLASASIQLLLHHRDLDFDVVNIGSGRTWSVDYLIEVISAIIGREIEVLRDPKRVRPVDRPVLCASTDRLFKSYNYVLQENLQTT